MQALHKPTWFHILMGRRPARAAYIIHANNEHYLRLRALRELTQGTYRQDVITGNISSYIVDGA